MRRHFLRPERSQQVNFVHGALFHGLSSRRHQRDGCHGGAFVHEHVVQRIFVGDEQVCADVELGNAELDHLNDIFIWCTGATMDDNGTGDGVDQFYQQVKVEIWLVFVKAMGGADGNG